MFYYHPLTAVPQKNNETYAEILPCRPLLPYIRCFWGSKVPYHYTGENKTSNLVIPDTCVDIIYNIDYTENRITGGFCGINDRAFYSHSPFPLGHTVATFGIRFFAWNAYRFSEDSLRNTLNEFIDIRACFSWLDGKLCHKLFDLTSLQEKAMFAEVLLLNKIAHTKICHPIDNAISILLANNGAIDIARLSKELFLSSRQLERNFHEYVGVTPKKLSNLIRYQLLWRDLISNPNMNIFDAVHKYGYTDQSHLAREFKRYHSMDIKTAIRLAVNHVENIQDMQADIY